MPRKLIPLTEDLANCESLMKFRNWEKNENFPAPSTGECSKTSGEKVKAMVSKWNRTMKKKVDDEKLDIFSTAKKASKDFATNKVKEKPEKKVDCVEQDSLKGPKLCKTVEEQKQVAIEREKKTMENCQSWKRLSSDKDVANYDEGKNISLQSLEGTSKPRAASRSVSFLLPNLPTTKMLQLAQPDTEIIVNETETAAYHDCNELSFDPREKQQEFDGNRIKVHCCGEKLFAKLYDSCKSKDNKRTTQKNCIDSKNSKLSVFELQRKQKSVIEMTLGKPYGIQLGSVHIGDDYFHEDLRNKQALDVLLVAHGMTYIKSPVCWTRHDIDKILIIGTELYKETKDIKIDTLSLFTKGFTIKNQFIQVTVSDPFVVGEVMNMSNDSTNLQNGLTKFLSQHKHGILMTPEVDVYFQRSKMVYVFDPRGRTMDCERNSQGEAGLMAFGSINNLYHLLVNLSCINVKSTFKICPVTVTKITNSDKTAEKFTAVSGNPMRKCRNDDYKIINKRVALLQGSLHLNSEVFGNLSSHHHLPTAIMAMVYSKIDPPNSWSSAILDRVLHFGAKLYSICIDDGPIRNLTLNEIPSHFYIGDVYCVGIAIAPFLKRVGIEKTRLFCDNAITKVLKNILETLSFRCLLLQIDSFTYAVWVTADVFYFFDGCQKDASGKLDAQKGCSCLLMTDSFDKLCEIVVNRVLTTPRLDTSPLNIHGLKILELIKLNQKCMPKLKLMKPEGVKIIKASEADEFKDSPSTVDSIAPLLTEEEILKLHLEKSSHRNAPNLTSSSPDLNLHIDIMSSVGGKLSFIEREDCSRETFEVIKKVQSEIVQNAIDDELMSSKEVEENESEEERSKCSPCEKDCEHSSVSAEKVLLKTDLNCLEQERDEVLKNAAKPQDFFPELLKQEKSLFEKLPDGSEIIRGTKKMFELPLERQIYNFENLSVLVGISAIVTSTKYSIGSWTPETVDYVTACACIMSGAIELNNRMDFYTYEKHQLPKIHVRNKFYNLKMAAVQNGMWCNLEKILGKVFKSLDRFVVITPRGSLAVFSRQDFYYVFEYSTCNVVGFRIKNNEFGASCFLRFPDIHSLVRRIYANHKDVHDQQKFLISLVIAERIKNLQEHDEYVPFSASQEIEIVEQLRSNQMMRRDQMIDKIRAVNTKICAEKERIKKYRDETGKMVLENIDVDCLPAGSFDTTAFFNEDDFRLDRSSLIKSQELMRSVPLHEDYQDDDCVGFQVCDDGTLRIQGSFALSDQNSQDDLKACHFTGVFAIMYAVHHPVESMNFRSVDIVLENGKRIGNKVDTDDYRKTRTLRDVVIDSTSYELMTVEFCPKKTNLDNFSTEEDIKMYLKEFFSHQKYGLIKAKCCCLVVIKECDCFYLFDPYVENSETATAAWYKLEDFEAVFHYLLTLKCLNPNLVSDIRVQYVKVLSYKTIKPPKAGYFLFNLPPNQSPSNQKSCHVVEQDEDEKIEWICSTKTVPWSRLEMRNAMNVDRYLSASKWKEFDVEMDNKLYSLWGNIHPNMKIFNIHAGKQHLTCALISLVMAHMYKIDEWDAILLDSIVAHGHKYYLESVKKIHQLNYELKIEDLRPNCSINNFVFDVSIKPIIYGKLYDEDRHNFNLNRAINYVFRSKNLSGVILQCNGKFLAVGNVNNRDYFMFDSQAHGPPLFSSNQGTSYVLKCCCLKVLLACIVLTLDIKRHNVKFYIYAVNTKISDETGRKKYEEEIANEQLAKENIAPEISTSGSMTNFHITSTSSEMNGEDLLAENSRTSVGPSEFRIQTASTGIVETSRLDAELPALYEMTPVALQAQALASVQVLPAAIPIPEAPQIHVSQEITSNVQANLLAPQEVTTFQPVQQTIDLTSSPLTVLVKTPTLRSTDQTSPMTSATVQALKLPLQAPPASLRVDSTQSSKATKTPSPTKVQTTSSALSAQSASTTTVLTPSTSSKTKTVAFTKNGGENNLNLNLQP